MPPRRASSRASLRPRAGRYESGAPLRSLRRVIRHARDRDSASRHRRRRPLAARPRRPPVAAVSPSCVGVVQLSCPSRPPCTTALEDIRSEGTISWRSSILWSRRCSIPPYILTFPPPVLQVLIHTRIFQKFDMLVEKNCSSDVINFGNDGLCGGIPYKNCHLAPSQPPRSHTGNLP